MDSNKKTKHKISTENIIILLLLCLASMNFLNMYYYFIFAAFIFFCANPSKKIHIDIFPYSALFFLALSYLLFAQTATSSILGYFKPFTYLLCYILGTSLLDTENINSKKGTSVILLYFLVIAITFGSLAHYGLNWFSNLSTDITRNTTDIWTHRPMAATGQAAMACLPLAVSIALLFAKTNKKIKIIAIAVLLIIIGYNLVLSGRTLFLLMLIISAVAFVHLLINQKNKRLKLIIIFILIIFAIVFIYQINFMGIKDYIESSPFFERFLGENSTTKLDEDNRMETKLSFLQNMLSFPFGSGNLRERFGYAHDLYLDTFDDAGIFALIAIIAFMLSSANHLINCLKNKQLSFTLRQLIFCLYILLYIFFWFEPILIGCPWLFASFCLIDGYVARIAESKNNMRLSYANSTD